MLLRRLVSPPRFHFPLKAFWLIENESDNRPLVVLVAAMSLRFVAAASTSTPRGGNASTEFRSKLCNVTADRTHANDFRSVQCFEVFFFYR